MRNFFESDSDYQQLSRVVDTGTHDQLMLRGGIYRDLYELQFSDDLVGESEPVLTATPEGQ